MADIVSVQAHYVELVLQQRSNVTPVFYPRSSRLYQQQLGQHCHSYDTVFVVVVIIPTGDALGPTARGQLWNYS